MMIKVINPGSQDFGEKIAAEVKISSRGLIGDDLKSMIKRAGSRFAEELKKMSFAKGEIPIHLIAIGATEKFSSNRNGDAFSIATCRRDHVTFVTKPVTKEGAFFFRDHNNKNPLQSYGIVKDSHFNEDMSRIELIVALNGTKEAADRNNGLLADKELEKIANGKDIAVSMATRVPFDICSGCHNRARSRAEYCDESTCKYGGLKRNITKVAEDGHVLFADNPDCNFFDISHVFRPADRIAYVLGHAKAAAAGQVVSGAELAEMWGLAHPLDGFSSSMASDTAARLKLAYDLADIEKKITKNYALLSEEVNRALDPRVRETAINLESFTKCASLRKRALNSLTRKKILLPLEDFLKLHEKDASLAQRAAQRLPGIYGRIIGEPHAEQLVDEYTDVSRPKPDGVGISQWAEKHAADYSLHEKEVRGRVLKSALRQLGAPTVLDLEKSALQDDVAESIARQYALYKLAFLDAWRFEASSRDQMAELVVRQNYLRI